ncbi:hypothetical protein KGQ64_18260, partial [bacterium]|nr:hypothetical protein [bacterium]
VHAATQFLPSEITRSPEGRGAYRYREQPRTARVEVFTREPPSPQELESQAFLRGLQGMGSCGPPAVLCFEDRAAPAGEAAAGLAIRCEARRGHRSNPGRPGELDLAVTRLERRTHRGGVCCYQWVQFCGGGRLLRRAGRVLVAPTVQCAGTSDDALAVLVREQLGDAAERSSLAASWAREASFEHGSVFSFDGALAALRVLGAPEEIVRSTASARADETRHAAVLYRLAGAIAGVPLGPGPIALDPVPVPSLARFAGDLFVEACANETIAVAQTQAALADPLILPAVAAILGPIVEDELSHVELAWRTLGWCLSADDRSVRAAIADALEAFEASLTFEHAGGDDVPASVASPWGLLPARDKHLVRLRCAREVIVPCARTLLARPRSRVAIEANAPA